MWSKSLSQVIYFLTKGCAGSELLSLILVLPSNPWNILARLQLCFSYIDIVFSHHHPNITLQALCLPIHYLVVLPFFVAIIVFSLRHHKHSRLDERLDDLVVLFLCNLYATGKLAYFQCYATKTSPVMHASNIQYRCTS
ncbi:hypothetical protein BJ878DRAFT_486455 [Calycina marina]|uniref:Uncharacterized protein n=1 Tax=Calycina marina TaxID=1763456 RepID=A0A9P8CIY0_9HELO|nr:hypothetical protein BJ878DRAFT_486455 [Calycina marina]